MSILFTLVTFLLFITISYLRYSKAEAAKRPQIAFAAGAQPPEMIRELGFEIPKGYAFQPGHTWAAAESDQQARVGVDSFAATLLGKVEAVETGEVSRWIRQGQKVMTLKRDGLAVDLVSPVEGVVIGVNPKVLKDPGLIAKDPYGEGWVMRIHSPNLPTNQRNLIRGSMVRPWMAHTLTRFKELASPLVGAVAQDGGMPVSGLLAQVDEGLRQAMIREFFLT
jgi:glycine cleavage system H lipoate-binding protein